MGDKIKLCCLLIILLLSLSGLSAVTLTSNKNVSYDSEIKELFLIRDKVPVIVKIKDVSNISVSKEDPIEVQITKDNERIFILNNISAFIISTLSEDEFELENIFPNGNGFYGNITKEGFEKLLKDERVKKIYDNTITGRVESIFSIKTLLILLIFVLLLIFLIFFLIKNKKRGKYVKKKGNHTN